MEGKFKLGLFFVGAGGSTATLSMFVISLLKNKLIECGKNFVTSLDCFKNMKFINATDVYTIGGVDIKKVRLEDNVRFVSDRDSLHLEKYIDNDKEAGEWDKNFSIGITEKDLGSNKKSIEKIKRILDDFRSKNKLDEVIVIYLASAEEHYDYLDKITLSQLNKIIEENKEVLPPNVLYTYAIFDLGIPFINFTSCQANSIPALKELAELKKVCHAGKDGKTGETYVKSVLAPAFAARNFDVLMWESHNVLGDNDGLTLKDEKLKKDKLNDKKLSIKDLGKNVEHNVRIDYVRSLGDWKTAWDLVEWEGLLGSRMSLQFIWKGHDGLLAAPMIWDLVRFMELAKRSGKYGVQKNLSFFFKNPIDYNVQDALKQFELIKSRPTTY